jgi:Zn-finger nucleic acid-binding protein
MKVEEGRNFFHCDYCGNYEFPDPNQDGVVLLDEISPYSCPICLKPLVKASIEEVGIFSCPICRGNLIEQSKMLSILRQAPDLERAGEEHHSSRDELQRRVTCPECQAGMDTYQYGGPGNVIIQGCIHCELVWLDFGEIAKILRSYARIYRHPSDDAGQKNQSIDF